MPIDHPARYVFRALLTCAAALCGGCYRAPSASGPSPQDAAAVDDLQSPSDASPQDAVTANDRPLLAEECNGIDDDGDGDIDEGYVCSGNAIQRCLRCERIPGTQACNARTCTWSRACEVSPGWELRARGDDPVLRPATSGPCTPIVGARNGTGWTVSGGSGYLTNGPALPMPAGVYALTVTGSAWRGGLSVEVWDATANRSLFGPRGEGTDLNTVPIGIREEFVIPEAAECHEIRVCVLGHGEGASWPLNAGSATLNEVTLYRR